MRIKTYDGSDYLSTIIGDTPVPPGKNGIRSLNSSCEKPYRNNQIQVMGHPEWPEADKR